MVVSSICDKELYSWNINSSFFIFFFLRTISNQGEWSCSFNTLFRKLFSLTSNSIICWKHLKQFIQVLYFSFYCKAHLFSIYHSMSSLQSEATQIIFSIASISHKTLPILLLSNSNVTYILPGICDSNAQLTHTPISLSSSGCCVRTPLTLWLNKWHAFSYIHRLECLKSRAQLISFLVRVLFLIIDSYPHMVPLICPFLGARGGRAIKLFSVSLLKRVLLLPNPNLLRVT